jgi:hypothetical protein
MRFKVPEGLKYFCQSEVAFFKSMLFTENVKFM